MRLLLAQDGATFELADAPPRQGGEAAVYDAVGPDGPCVLKVALGPGPHGAWLDVERERLEELGRDPATAARVPRVLGHGLWDDRPFVALERFPSTAAEALDRPLPERLALAARVADVIAALREARPDLVHRDLKPSNLLVDGDRVVVTDFGSARLIPIGRTTTTRALLTPGYAAPEQSLPHRCPDPSWDLFGLAATVYHLVVGAPANAPGTHPWRLTERGRRMRAGADDGRAEPWEYLDLRRAQALDRGDLARLDALVTGPLRRALLGALAPDPRQRRGTPASLAAAIRATRPRGWRPDPRLVYASGLVAAAGSLWYASRPDPVPYELVSIAGGRAVTEDGPVEVAPFSLGAREVSQAQWRQVMGMTLAQRRRVTEGGIAEPCLSFRDLSMLGEHLPMMCVDFLDAVRFANALSERHGLTPAYTIAPTPSEEGADVRWDPEGDGYRLPTVEEWLLVARPADGRMPVDACAENVADRRFREIAPVAPAYDCDDGYVGPSPVGAYTPGPYGLFDVYGNVAEWLWAEPDRGRRPGTPGSWTSGPDPSTFMIGRVEETYRWVTHGFRLARSRP